MRVALVSGEFPPDLGGTATHSATVLTQLEDRGHSVTLLSLWDGNRIRTGTRSHLFPRQWPWPLRLALVVLWLARNRRHYDVVYAVSMHQAAALGSLLARRALVVRLGGDQTWERASRLGLTALSFDSFQEAPPSGFRVRAMCALRNWAVGRARGVAVVSDYLGAVVKRWAPCEPVTIRQGVRLAAAGPARSKGLPLKAIFVGRLIELKRVDLLIDAIARTHDVELLVLGDGPEASRLEDRCRRHGLADRVRFLGAVDHGSVMEHLADASVLVLPSETESGGPTHATAEALACGTPVITTRVGGQPEIVKDDHNGLLIDPESLDSDSISAALARLRDDIGLRKRLSEQALEDAAGLSIERCVDRVEDLLRAAMSPGPDANRVGRSRPDGSPPRVVCLRLAVPSCSFTFPDDPAFEALRHSALDWILAEGWEVHFWGLRCRTAESSSNYETAEIGPRFPLHLIPVPFQILVSSIVQFALGMRRARPGVVVAPMPLFGAGIAAAKALGRLRDPLIVRVIARSSSNAQRVHPSRVRYRIIEAVEKFVLRQADLVLPLGTFTRRLAEEAGVAPQSILELPDPAGSPSFVNGEPTLRIGAPRIAFAGRLVPEKGVDILLRAFANLATDFPDVRLHIAGDGVQRSALETLSEELEIHDRIQWHGFLPITAMPQFYRSMTMVVMPSRFEEGLGRTLVEAGSAGCALIATDLGGLADVIEHEKTGVLVPPDDVAALEAALRALLASPGEIARLGSSARERALEIYERRDAAIEELRGIFRDHAAGRGRFRPH